MAIYPAITRRTAQGVDPRAKVIDEMQRMSLERRNAFLGSDWFRTVRILYNLLQGSGSRPSFRPLVTLPQLQLLAFNEATDLSALSPKVYITKKQERDKDRERAFQDDWRAQSINNRLLFAELWGLYAGTSFLQVGYDPSSRGGRGEVWTDWLDPEHVYPDPAARNDTDWTYVILETRLYPDQVRAFWPETAQGLTARPTAGALPTMRGAEGAGFSFEMPPGPLSFMAGAGAQAKATPDGRVRVRVMFADDYSVTEAKEPEVAKALKALKSASPKIKRLYPDGRFMVECEGRILADGNNPFPPTDLVKFPVIPLWTLPNITSFWAPPPPRFSLDLQELAARMLSQTYENAVRLNNGIWFVDENTGIDAEDFGGLPGEVRIINGNSRIPEVRWPAAMPAHMVQLPTFLLQLQKELWGFSQVREGQPGRGNVSASLFDASLYQSQFLTRLRSMLLAETVQKLAECRFFTMMRYYKNSRQYPAFNQEKGAAEPFGFSEWKAPDGDEYQVNLDPASIRPISQAALRQLILSLRAAGMVGVEDALEALEIPNAEEIAQRVAEEAQLAALAKVKKR